METASANPFVSQNGSDMFCGGQHRTAQVFDDGEDFGPETDVDMVDDVLLSPAKLVHGKQGLEDDLERQRQQLADFDDPEDIEKSRDTPTPPAHEVVSNTNADNLAESGGEESEEEWNYIPGRDNKPDSDTQDHDDMSSQLNPNAAEFVPVSPTRLLMLDDAIISASPRLGFEKSLDNIQMPTEVEFHNEIAQRPGDLDFDNGPRHGGDDLFMRDNFSTLRNKGKDLNVSSTHSDDFDASIITINSSANPVDTSASEDTPFDKLEAVQNMEEKVTSCILEKENAFETKNKENGLEFNSNTFGTANIFAKSDPMTTSIIGIQNLSSSPEPEDRLIPGTPKSTTAEAPASPIIDDVSPVNHQTDLDSPADDYEINAEKSPELMSPVDGPQDGLTPGRERTSSSGFESESGAEEVETNAPEESSEGFITELRRSPPIDLTFKPIETFSDTNPFGTLQTPSSTTPLDQPITHPIVDIEQIEAQIETPEKHVAEDKPVGDTFDNLQNTPSSFISLRKSTAEDLPVPFEDLESPKDIPQFEFPPNANSSLLATELPKSPETQNFDDDTLSPIKQEPSAEEVEDQSSNITANNTSQDLFLSDTIPQCEENKLTAENTEQEEESSITSHVDLDTTEGFLVEESKILLDEQECEQTSKLNEEINIDIPVSAEPDLISNDVSPKAVEQVLAAFDDIKVDNEIESKPEPHEADKESDFVLETKEMKLEFESHIANSVTTPEEFKHSDDGFEVISKEELRETETSLADADPVDVTEPTLAQENTDVLSPLKQTNPFIVEDSLATFENVQTPEEKAEAEPVVAETLTTGNYLSSAIDDFNLAVTEELVAPEKSTLLSSAEETSSVVEPQATKTLSYQTLTPAEEPKISKSESYVTGVKKEAPAISPLPDVPHEEISKALQEEPVIEKPVVEEPVVEEPAQVETKPQVQEEPVPVKSEPVQSQVVTETLITALEETSEVPSVATTEVPSTAGTPPPTPAPGLEDKDDSSNTDMLVAAVAAAGAVAAGTAIVAEKAVKKVDTATAKKPLPTATKKPDTTTKAPAKAPTKAPAAKPAATKTTTTKPAGTATKPVGSSTTAKPATTKPTGTATTKPAGSTTAPKPSAPKPAAGAPSAAKKPLPTTKPVAAKPTTTTVGPKLTAGAAPKTVPPKQLSVSSKSSAPVLKSSSKPTTPTSKPSTPTTPTAKLDVKTPPRPAVKSTTMTTKVGATKSVGAAGAEKKPLTNGDVKPAVKKTEAPIKKPLTTTAKPSSTAAPKPTSVAAKAPTVTSTKPAVTKTTAAPQAKPKPAATAPTTKSAPVPIKRPTAPAVKTTDKSGKDSVNKQISNAKPAVNGKVAPSKPTGIKKTDTKTNGKVPVGKPAPIKKPEIVKEEEQKLIQIQEDNVTTTNGFAEHIEEHESAEIVELAPVIVDAVN